MASYRKLGRVSSHRNAMLRNLVTEIIRYKKVTTTEARAKEAGRMAQKMITLGKRGDLHARRQAAAYMMDDAVVKSLFEEVAPQYQDRTGGYLRVLKTEPRKGDGAAMAIVELV